MTINWINTLSKRGMTFIWIVLLHKNVMPNIFLSPALYLEHAESKSQTWLLIGSICKEKMSHAESAKEYFFCNLVVLIHFLEAWSLLGAVHFICQHILEVWLIIGLCLTKIYSMPCIQPYTFWGIEIWLLYGPLQVPCLEAWLLIGTCLLIGTKE